MSGWRPTSPCQPSCAVHRTRPRVGPRTVATWAMRCAVILIRGSMVFARARFFSTVNRQRIARRWSCLMLAALGIRLDVRGWLPADRGPVGVLHVANHISWIDNLALAATFPLPGMAKQEVADWPMIGRFARGLGTIFIDRDRLRSLPGDRPGWARYCARVLACWSPRRRRRGAAREWAGSVRQCSRQRSCRSRGTTDRHSLPHRGRWAHSGGSLRRSRFPDPVSAQGDRHPRPGGRAAFPAGPARTNIDRPPGAGPVGGVLDRRHHRAVGPDGGPAPDPGSCASGYS